MKIELFLFTIGLILDNLTATSGQDNSSGDDDAIIIDWVDVFSLLVQTPTGPILGIITQVLAIPVQTFLGIPYARPPVGNLRFAKPVPMNPWTKTYNASSMPPACIQYTTYPYPWYDNSPNKSEDCLYLNIWAPIDASPGSNKSVMFLIHGGESFGSNRMDLYDGRALAGLGDVIVVSPNYRLSLFGFLTSGTRDLPGNYGIWDLLLALKWVRKNIEFFGGNPNQITLHGQSSGSLIISMLCLSPLTKGLFSKAIMVSGSVVYMQVNTAIYNAQFSQRLARAVGCATNDRSIQSDTDSVISCLRRKDAFYLARVLYTFDPASELHFMPLYGDELFPNPPIEDLQNGRFQQIPILIGHNRNEGVTEITSLPDTFGFFGDNNPMVNKTFAKYLIQYSFVGYKCSIDAVADYYFNNVGETDYFNIRQQLYLAYGDITLACPTDYFAECYAKKNNTVFFFLFSHRPTVSPWAPWIGTTHYDETQFVFGQPIRNQSQYSIHEFDLSMKMIEFWTNFAKYGNPITLFQWPKYSSENRSLIILDSGINPIRKGTNPSKKSCDFLRSCFTF
ncbi:acetylcholinesterase-1 [Nephila pilipes]|uniref:Carboxylic ester hydrolase n=1 Tax=Nephila pilipes TaxID=299642 RepID=A0A8X6NB34_NEPPI|nr:acetylcholinesterase-1 [Nephila pilipes]